jgi:hypothetical protein
MFSCPGLNPSVFPSVNSSEKNPRHPAVAIFKKHFSPSAMPAASPTVFFRRVIPTDFETELFPSVIPLVLSDFLVVCFFKEKIDFK